jgi:hypothetical protein
MDQNSSKNDHLQNQEQPEVAEYVNETLHDKRSIPNLNAYENMPMMRVNILSKTRPSEPNNLNYENEWNQPNLI